MRRNETKNNDKAKDAMKEKTKTKPLDLSDLLIENALTVNHIANFGLSPNRNQKRPPFARWPFVLG